MNLVSLLPMFAGNPYHQLNVLYMIIQMANCHTKNAKYQINAYCIPRSEKMYKILNCKCSFYGFHYLLLSIQ